MISILLWAAPAHLLGGALPQPAPIHAQWADPIVVSPQLRLASRASAVSDVPIDTDNQLRIDPALSTLVRAGLHIDTGRLHGFVNVAFDLEYDLIDVRGGAEPVVPVNFAPDSAHSTHFLRKAAGRLVVGPFVTLGGGLMTNHWGLGLLANDGAHGWTPGSAYFTDPRGGDQVIRAFIGTGPHDGWSAFAALDEAHQAGCQRNRITPPVDGFGGFTPAYRVPVACYGDDALRPDDTANQFVIAARKAGWGGLWVALREQRSVEERRTLVAVVDGYFDRTFRVDDWRLRVAGEFAWIRGETQLAASPEFSFQSVDQLGAVLKLGAEGDDFGSLLDVVYLSGDSDAADGVQSGFRADVNFDQGLLLFPYLNAATSGRARYTAGDPDLVGYPARDLNRLPSNGVATQVLSLFPRFFGRPVRGVELYGGALFAFAPEPPADPLQSRLNGGVPASAFGGTAGNYLGTEVDLGVRYRAVLWGTELVLGAEGGVFTPGDAFVNGANQRRGALTGGRLLLRYTL